MKHLRSKDFATVGQVGEEVVVKFSRSGKKREVDVEKRTATFVFSDGSLDRGGDIVNPDGWDLKDFKNNPICIWAHQNRTPPIGKVIALRVIDKQLIGTIQFATKEEYEFADTVFRLIVGEYLNAVSVGFRPVEWEIRRSKDGQYEGVTYKRQQLLEISVVPVPMLASALVQAKSAGIDTSVVESSARTLVESVIVEDDDRLAIERAIRTLERSEEASSEIQRPRLVDVQGITYAYDKDNVFMGLIRNGKLEVSADYQEGLARRNVETIDRAEQAPAFVGHKSEIGARQQAASKLSVMKARLRLIA